MIRGRGFRIAVWVLVVCTGVAVGVGGAVADDANEAPLADAGLDQTVKLNETVYLDATGSVDPDGEVVSYEWTVESPTGSEFDPACPGCARTHFMVTAVGTYNATVTVTDDDGAARSDTLRVTVEPVELPSVGLTGPDELVVGTGGDFDATATAGDAPLVSIKWAVDGRRVSSEDVEGETANATLSRSFSSTGETEVRVRVVDLMGRTRTASKTVTVVSSESRDRNASLGALNFETRDSSCSDTDMPQADPCEDQILYDISDGDVIIDDGNNDGIYPKGYGMLVERDRNGGMTEVVRFNPDKLISRISSRLSAKTKTNKKTSGLSRRWSNSGGGGSSGGGSGGNNDNSGNNGGGGGGIDYHP